MAKETLKQYTKLVRQNWRSAVVMLICIPSGAALIDSALPYTLAQAIGGISSSAVSTIHNWLWAGAAIGLLGAVLNYVGFRAMVQHEGFMFEHLRQNTFRSLITKDVAFFSNQKIGAMTSRYIDYIRSYGALQDLFIIRTLSFILTVGVGLILVALASWIVSVILLGLIVLLVLQIRWSARHRAPWRHERKSLVAQIHGEVADSLTNSLVVKSYANERREQNNISKLSRRFRNIYVKDIGFVMTEGSLRVLFLVIVQIITIAASIAFVQDGTMALATGIFVLAYIQRIGSQLFVLSDIINGYDQAFLDAQPMTKMLLTPTHVRDSDDAQVLNVKGATIAMSHVSYRYEDGTPYVIDDLSIQINSGQKIGLVGHSGAGKSTIVQLLLRFSDVSHGSITVDGHDIRTVTQESLRRSISYVAQEPALFHRSLRENIAYGKEDATTDEIVAAAKRAHAWEFIEKLPDGLDTIVGERGVKLSGGQRQRIAIARAILKDAPILVLDEATSALDSESEKLIQASLEELMKGRTSLVIAHRLSTLRHMDRIVVLDGGKIIEDGTHAELLKRGGTYASLWNHQSGGFIEE